MNDLLGKIKQYFVNGENQKQISKKEICVLLILFGILFMVIRVPQESKQRVTEKSQTTGTKQDIEAPDYQGIHETDSDYVMELTERTQKILAKMDGIGRVTVMLTLKDDGSINVEKDIEIQSDTENTRDASGGDRQQSREERKESTCYYEDETGKEIPIVTRRDKPLVEGVFVVCEGGDDEEVKLQILNACQALFGIEAHKIVIVKGNTSGRSAE